MYFLLDFKKLIHIVSGNFVGQKLDVFAFFKFLQQTKQNNNNNKRWQE